MGWGRKGGLTPWAGSTWSQVALGLSPCPQPLGQGSGQLALGPGKPMGPSMPGSPCGRRREGHGCKPSLVDGPLGGEGGHSPVVPSVQALQVHPCCPWHPKSKQKGKLRQGEVGGPPGTLSRGQCGQGFWSLPGDDGNATSGCPRVGSAALCQTRARFDPISLSSDSPGWTPTEAPLQGLTPSLGGAHPHPETPTPLDPGWGHLSSMPRS